MNSNSRASSQAAPEVRIIMTAATGLMRHDR